MTRTSRQVESAVYVYYKAVGSNKFWTMKELGDYGDGENLLRTHKLVCSPSYIPEEIEDWVKDDHGYMKIETGSERYDRVDEESGTTRSFWLTDRADDLPTKIIVLSEPLGFEIKHRLDPDMI